MWQRKWVVETTERKKRKYRENRERNRQSEHSFYFLFLFLSADMHKNPILRGFGVRTYKVCRRMTKIPLCLLRSVVISLFKNIIIYSL